MSWSGMVSPVPDGSFCLAPVTQARSLNQTAPALPGVFPEELIPAEQSYFFSLIEKLPTGTGHWKKELREQFEREKRQARETLLSKEKPGKVLGAFLKYLVVKKPATGLRNEILSLLFEMGGERFVYLFFSGLAGLENRDELTPVDEAVSFILQRDDLLGSFFEAAAPYLKEHAGRLDAKTVTLLRRSFVPFIEEESRHYYCRLRALEAFGELQPGDENSRLYYKRLLSYARPGRIPPQLNATAASLMRRHSGINFIYYLRLYKEDPVLIRSVFSRFVGIEPVHVRAVYPDQNKEVAERVLNLIDELEDARLYLNHLFDSPLIRPDLSAVQIQKEIVPLLNHIDRFKQEIGDQAFEEFVRQWGFDRVTRWLDLTLRSPEVVDLHVMIFLARGSGSLQVPGWPYELTLPMEFTTSSSDTALAKGLAALYEEGGLERISQFAPLAIGNPNRMNSHRVINLMSEAARNPARTAPLLARLIVLLRLIELEVEETDWVQIPLTRLLNHPGWKKTQFLISRLIQDVPHSKDDRTLFSVRRAAHQLARENRRRGGRNELFKFLRLKIHRDPGPTDLSFVETIWRVYRDIEEAGFSQSAIAPLKKYIPEMYFSKIAENLKKEVEEKWLVSPENKRLIAALLQKLKERYGYDTQSVLQDFFIEPEPGLSSLSLIREYLIPARKKRWNKLNQHFDKIEVLASYAEKRHIAREDYGFLNFGYVGQYRETKLSAFYEDIRLKKLIEDHLEKAFTEVSRDGEEPVLRNFIVLLIDHLRFSGLTSHRMIQLQKGLESETLGSDQKKELAAAVEQELFRLYDFYNMHFRSLIRETVSQMPASSLAEPYSSVLKEKGASGLVEVFMGDLIAEEPVIDLLQKTLQVYQLQIRDDSMEIPSPAERGPLIQRIYPDMVSNSIASPVVIGTKAGNLAEAAARGFPVPPGFALTPHLQSKVRDPQEFRWLVLNELLFLEKQAGRRFPFDLGSMSELENDLILRTRKEWEPRSGSPLLVSVRSGSFISMPGFLTSVLNVPATTEVGDKMKKAGEEPEFVEDVMARFKKSSAQMQVDSEGDPFQLLLSAIESVYYSWDSSRVAEYRQTHHISETWGTAVLVQQMVYGNKPAGSWSGVLHSHDLSTGELFVHGDLTKQGQGEDVVGGKAKNTVSLRGRDESEKDLSLEIINRDLYIEMRNLVEELVFFSGTPVEVEVTVEEGTLYLLQVRPVDLIIKGPRLAATEKPLFAEGKGIAGGALNARFLLARENAEETVLAAKELRREMDARGEEDSGIVLLSEYVSPDTATALLSREIDGAVSLAATGSAHAALVARKLNKTMIAVDKRTYAALKVQEGITGERWSLDGNIPGNSPTSGYIYRGVVAVKPQKRFDAGGKNKSRFPGLGKDPAGWSI